jgi:hypothetical protein
MNRGNFWITFLQQWSHAIVAFVIPLVAMLTSTLVMWHEEHFLDV